MKSKLLLIVILFQFSSYMAEAQAPGYLGKTLLVGYEINFFPQIAYDYDRDYFPPTFNIRSGIAADYVIQRHKTVGLSIYKFNSAFDFKKNVNYSSEYLGTYYSDLWFYSNTEAKLKTTAIAANIKLFSQQHLAPLGTYAKFEIIYSRSKVEYDTSEVYSNGVFDSQGIMVIPDYINRGNYSNLGFGFTCGLQRIYFDKLVINIGTQIGWMFTANPIYVFDDYALSLDVSDYFKNQVSRRLAYHYGINLQGGIAYLIY